MLGSRAAEAAKYSSKGSNDKSGVSLTDFEVSQIKDVVEFEFDENGNPIIN